MSNAAERNVGESDFQTDWFSAFREAFILWRRGVFSEETQKFRFVSKLPLQICFRESIPLPSGTHQSCSSPNIGCSSSSFSGHWATWESERETKQEGEREEGEIEKAISNGAFSASGCITSQTGLDKIASGIVLACNVITSQPGVKAVCTGLSTCERKTERKTKKLNKLKRSSNSTSSWYLSLPRKRAPDQRFLWREQINTQTAGRRVL